MRDNIDRIYSNFLKCRSKNRITDRREVTPRGLPRWGSRWVHNIILVPRGRAPFGLTKDQKERGLWGREWVHKRLERYAWSKLVAYRRGLFRVCNGNVVFNTTGFNAFDFSVLRPLKYYFLTFLS